MNHLATTEFWSAFDELPGVIRARANAAFELLKADPRHPSLHLRRVGPYWSARVDLNHRALAVPIEGGLLWFWIGTHKDYDRILG